MPGGPGVVELVRDGGGDEPDGEGSLVHLTLQGVTRDDHGGDGDVTGRFDIMTVQKERWRRQRTRGVGGVERGVFQESSQSGNGPPETGRPEGPASAGAFVGGGADPGILRTWS